MTTLTRQTTIGRDGRFATIEAATEHYAQYNMRLVSQTSDCAEFGAVVVETQAVSRYGRPINYGEAKYSRPSAFAAGKPAAKPRTQLETAPSPQPVPQPTPVEQTRLCKACGADCDPTLTMRMCRVCYRAYYRHRYTANPEYAARLRERSRARYAANGAHIRYRADECRECGGVRDATLKRALCRPCYRAEKREAKKKTA